MRRPSAAPAAPAPPQRLLRELLFLAFSAWRRNDDWIADRLWRAVGERRVAAGERMYTLGEAPDRVYFMDEGRVRFERPGAPSFVREGRWVMGIQEAVSGTPRYRTALALTDLRLLTVPAETWVSILEDNVEVAREMAIEGARGVIALHEQLAPDGGFAPPGARCSIAASTLNLVERLLLLRDAQFLGGAGVQALTDLARASNEVSFAAGDVILPRGVPRRHVHVVIEGLVEMRHEAPAITGRFGPGDFVGNATGIGDAGLAWEARAVQPTRTLALPLDMWADEVDDHFDLFRSAMAALLVQREELTDELARRSDDLVLR